MNKKKWLFSAWLSLFAGLITAQAQSPYKCYTDQLEQEFTSRFPGQAAHKANLEQQIQQYISQQQNQKTNGMVLKIPVVIHVVSEKGCNSISKAQILNGLEVVNQDFRRQNPDTVNTRAIFKPFAADTEIEFVLARKDPNGNPTDGINRVTSPLAMVPANRSDLQKAVPGWSPSEYFNIWLVDSIYDSNAGYNIAGYSQFPNGIMPWSTYGVVLTHSVWGKQFAVPGTTAKTSGHYASHEIAHCFNLLHVEGVNCTDADGVADTPPAIFQSNVPTCNFNLNTCPGDSYPDQVENYMSISTDNCTNMFTNGQKLRMHAAINSIPQLQNLVSASNALATGIDPNVTVGPLAPRPYFCSDTRRICAGSSVTFSDISYQGPSVSRTWTFAGGTPATSTSQYPVVTYNTPGKYAVTLTLNNGTNSYPGTTTNYIEVMPVTNLINVSPPNYYVESFNEATFPVSATANRIWEMKTSSLDANPLNWTRTGAAHSSITYSGGTSSLKLNNGAIPDGTVSTLITPNFRGGASRVFFEMAYAKRVAQSNDELRVYASHDCGATWGAPLLTLTGNQLVTNGGATVSGTFVPTAAEWRIQDILTGGNPVIWGSAHTMFKIEAVSNGGGTLYIDNFTIGNVLGTDEELAAHHKIKLYPNPVTAESNLEFELKASGKVKLKILDLVGNTIYNGPETTFSAGKHSVLLGDKMKNQSKGMYLVQLQMEGKVFNTKLLL